MEWWMVPEEGNGTTDNEEEKRTGALAGNARGGDPNAKLKTAMRRKKGTTATTAEMRDLRRTVTISRAPPTRNMGRHMRTANGVGSIPSTGPRGVQIRPLEEKPDPTRPMSHDPIWRARQG
ncbi:hypothetical protein PIB30_007428 [Stylosanthes scabra]|uniref:Uncharacterized protein n=1 Tax=Stylosanthes scabra TaxID=79078 RepID=A0ABU6Q5T1_9FABA|nr:hypothetical protein [Stylosanthes scabra]